MSDHQNTTATDTPVTDSTIAPQTDDASKAEPTTALPAVESSKQDDIQPVTETKAASATEEQKDEVASEKPIEPITEGQLTLKGPGLLKSIIPSKKEFWLSDDAVSPQDLNSYMRGEKPEIAHAVVAWASQTGKGLLFFNKKGDTTKKSPGHVLALYDATDIKKEQPHEISFKLNGQELVLKATSDAERDGWYMSIAKSSEIGKASKEEIRESEGYKAEMEKLNKPNVAAGGAAAAAATKRTQSQPKKSTEVARADSSHRKNSDLSEEDKKEQKKSSRSASRGIIDRLKSKKDDKKEEKEEKKVEKEEAKPEDDSKAEEATAGSSAVAGVAAGAAAVGGASSENKKDETTESPVESTPKTEEKSKKRGSIFGKMQGWGAMKSPVKEKEQKDVELKPETPAKDAPVSENPPQLPDTTTESTEPAVEAFKADTDAKLATPEETKEVSTPSKEKPKFLSGLSFMNKRNRSVSPSTPMKEEPAKTEATPAEVPVEAEPVDAGKTDEAVAETTAVEPLKPEEKTDKETKRQSVLTNLGRRASKAFKGIQTPKKENTAPSTEAKKEETTEAAPVAETPITNGETKSAEPQQPHSIGDVVPEAIHAGKPEHQPAAISASA